MTVAYIDGGAGLARFDRAMENVEQDEAICDLIFLCVPFCEETVQHIVKLLGSRQFTSVMISRCSGQVDRVISAALETNVEQLELRGMMPRHFNESAVASAIRKGLESNSNNDGCLQRLCLSIMTLSSSMFDVLLQGVQHNTSLQTFHLSCCTIPTQAMPSMAKFLQAATHLETLKLDSCRLQDDQLAEIVQAISNHPNLQRLSLPYNKSRALTYKAISDWLCCRTTSTTTSTEQCALKELDCGRQQYCHGEEAKLEPIIKALQTNRSLTSLNLSYSNIRDDDMATLASVLATNPRLEEVYLCGNNLSFQAVTSLVKVFPSCLGLKKLWLTGEQQFGTPGAKLVTNALPTNVTLQELLLPQSSSETTTPTILEHDHNSQEEMQLQQHYLDLNRGGRHLFRKKNVPSGLWPHVLQRANRHLELQLKFPTDPPGADAQRQETDARRANIVYSLLRGHILLERQMR
jgi:Ran GTPase-activating protein (RanGAP) involved in mRNA processing and transport